MYNPRVVWNRLAMRFGRRRKGFEAIGVQGAGYINYFLDYISRQAVFDACKRVNIIEATVLDVGCGVGRLTIRYAENAKFVVGLDISTEMVKIAKERTKLFRHKLDYVVASSYALPFKENVFDIVNCVAVLIHVEDDKFKRSIQEISYVLRNQAHAILMESAPAKTIQPKYDSSRADSTSYPIIHRSVTHFLSQFELSNLSLISKKGVISSLSFRFLGWASILKTHVGRSEASHSRITISPAIRPAADVVVLFLILLSMGFDTIVSRVAPAFFYDHSESKMFLLSKCMNARARVRSF